MAAAALLFDLDGTLWDSREFFAAAASSADGQFNQWLHLLEAGMSAAVLLRKAGVSQSRFRSLLSSRSRRLNLYPQAQDVLRSLQSRALPMGVVTSLPGWIAQPMLKDAGIEQFFGVTIDWNRCRIVKPSPRPILLALEHLGVPPSADVWYVGDSRVDWQSARSAGVSFAWASYGYGPNRLADADSVICSLNDVLAL